MFKNSKNQKTKPGPKTNYTKAGVRLVAILPPSLVKEVEEIATVRMTNRRVIVQEALTEYVGKYKDKIHGSHMSDSESNN